MKALLKDLQNFAYSQIAKSQIFIKSIFSFFEDWLLNNFAMTTVSQMTQTSK